MNITKNWIAAFVATAGLGAAIVNASAVASADPGNTSVGPTAEVTHGDHQSQRRRATFEGGSVTEVKPKDLDAGDEK